MIELLPDIETLDKDSLCYSIYSQLYHNFFNAQDSGTVTEGDQTSIRLHNTAYNFASAIASGATGEGGGEGFLGYLKKTGGDMIGILRANNGFEAGAGNSRVLQVYNESGVTGVRVSGELRAGGSSLYLGEKQVLRYDKVNDRVTIDGASINMGSATVYSGGKIIVGESEGNGVSVSATGILVKRNPVYHRGNANLDTVDWKMQDGHVAGNLDVAGITTMSDRLVAEHGVSLGDDGKSLLSIERDDITIGGYLSFNTGYGIRIDSIPVFVRSNAKDIQVGAAGGDLLLGSGHTNKIRLLAGIADIDGDNLLITKYGGAYFPDSLTVRHNYGDTLLSSYRVDSSDEGMIIHEKLRFTNQYGAYLSGDDDGIVFSSRVEHITPDPPVREFVTYHTRFGYRASSSVYKPLNRFSDTLYISTDADFVCYDKPLEAKGHVGIDGSFTRMANGKLFFTNEIYLSSSTDGIKHYGNTYFLGNISSEYFSSGMAGSGWAILHNQTTGNFAATFDEITIRKKMRVYELEVQKNAATNGALWVSDACQGDTVLKL
ncbi:hypothetical protein [uncultured Bacteroides sp.]|uniref:hypothetical protein n=1 Tax=uncultured Bacteroides sp. TaxID=162156 RepID=UPI0025E30415|nr:hypothetical protein [uncultured Bacteroides sp.]